MAENTLQDNKLAKFKRSPHEYYLLLISILGGSIFIWSLIQFPDFAPKTNFFLLLILASVSHFTASTNPTASNKSAITYSIDPAIAIAAVPFLGVGAAVLIEAVSALVVWLLKPADAVTWKRSYKQLAFNSSMHMLSIFVSGWVLLSVRDWVGAETIWGATVPWLIAAVLNDQVNIWLLIIMLRLQFGSEIKLFALWKENAWSLPTGILVMSIGGAILALAMAQFGALGILVFFLPILLSALSDRSYVRQMHTHMDNLENIVAERTQELADLMKEKDQFLAVLTHDMKSPLTSIGIYASLIKDHPHLIIDRPDMASVIMRSQELLTDMVNNILDLEKIQVAGSIPLDRETIDLASMIDETIEPLSAQAAEKEIVLEVKIDPIPLITELDRSQFKRVIQNLVSNAIKYTPKEGHVRVNVATIDQHILINIQDDGYGIPVEELPFVFDRYHRVAKHKSIAAGTGLGLAITQAIVEAHDGNITVNSEEGKGSTFTIELPL